MEAREHDSTELGGLRIEQRTGSTEGSKCNSAMVATIACPVG